jgi:predicted acetyltransferase
VAEEDGRVTGYAQYRIRPGSWEDQHGDHTVVVRELIARTPGAVAGLWGLVLEHDLTARIEVSDRPEDDPLLGLLAGFRRIRPTMHDQLFVRVIDVPTALAARRYAAPGRLALSVHDPLGPTQVYRLEVGADGVADCRLTGDASDIELDIEDLGGCYLGRSRLLALARAGRLAGGARELVLADRMFGWEMAPWCQEMF